MADNLRTVALALLNRVDGDTVNRQPSGLNLVGAGLCPGLGDRCHATSQDEFIASRITRRLARKIQPPSPLNHF
jgi:hypothetical protein